MFTSQQEFMMSNPSNLTNNDYYKHYLNSMYQQQQLMIQQRHLNDDSIGMYIIYLI